MCQFKSAVVVRDEREKGGFRLLLSPWTESHSVLETIFKINERVRLICAKVEFSPDDITNAHLIEKYKLKIDEERTPEWFDDDMKLNVSEKLSDYIKNIIVTGDVDILIGGQFIVAPGCKVSCVRTCVISAVLGNASITDVRDNASITNVRDNASITNVRDNASITNVWDNASITGVRGNASITGVRDNASITGVRGNASITNVRDNASITGVWGNASITDVRGNASITNVRDNASITGVRDNASITGVWGNASITDVRDNASITGVWDNASITGDKRAKKIKFKL